MMFEHRCTTDAHIYDDVCTLLPGLLQEVRQRYVPGALKAVLPMTVSDWIVKRYMTGFANKYKEECGIATLDKVSIKMTVGCTMMTHTCLNNKRLYIHLSILHLMGFACFCSAKEVRRTNA